MKKTIISFLFCCLVFCVIPIDADAFTDGFVDQPIPYDANASQALASSDGYTYYGSQKVISTVPNTFCFIVGSKCWIGYKGEPGGSYYTSVSAQSGMSDSYQAIPGWYFNANWMYVNSDYAQYYYMPIFPSIDAAVAAAEASIDDSLTSYLYQIPAGYVAYISSSPGSTFSLAHNFGFNSRAFSDRWGDGSSLQAYKTGVSSLPSASTSFPLSGMTDISYVRDQNRNLLGQSRVGLASITSGSSGYTVIYNPLYRSDYKNYNEQVSAEEYYYNSTIQLTSSSISFFRLYPLSEAYTSLTTIEGSSISGYEDYTDVSVDPDTGEVVYTDQNGEVSLSPPAFGGTNQTPEPVGTANWLQQITVLLSNVVQSLGTIFGFAYEAIVTLVGAASAFVVTLGSLYAWLPAPLSSVLISAITVAITIGVFKAFL